MPFFEHYCNASTGSNMNGGSDEDATPKYAATNGGWDSGTGIFTPASGDPSAVSPTLVGQTANVFLDGATTPVFIARVTAVSSTTVTVSTTAKSGTAPTTAGTGISINVGGVWKGPNAAVVFPFGFITSTLTNASGHTPKVNLKNNATYSTTAAMTHANSLVMFQGYTSTVADGGRAIIDGGTSGASYVLLTCSGNDTPLKDLIFQNNGATGNAAGLVISSQGNICTRVVVNSVRGHGISVTAGNNQIVECEAYACNQSNTSNTAGFQCSATTRYIRCVSHDNAGSNAPGFTTSSGGHYEDCIADSNGARGFVNTGTATSSYKNCDAYNNTSDGMELANLGLIYIESCNFVKNGGWGINGSGGSFKNGAVVNCGFGSGTQANTSGTTTGLLQMVESGSITYAADVTPWVDPANGDFRIALAAAKGTGRGTFTQTAASYTGTVGYPDVGAAQHQDVGGGGGGGKILESSIIQGLGAI